MSRPQPSPVVQGSLFKADIAWFPVLCGMLRGGGAAELQPHTMMVYLTLKSYADFDTGIAQTTTETVARETGMSVRQAKICIGRLLEKGYVRRLQRGRRAHGSEYQIVERMPIKDHRNNTVAIADWEFVRRDWQDHLREVREAVLTELRRSVDTSRMQPNGQQLIVIQNLQVNIQLLDRQGSQPPLVTVQPAAPASPSLPGIHTQAAVRIYPQERN